MLSVASASRTQLDTSSGGIARKVPAQKPADGQEFANTIRDVYQAIDRQLGLLLAQMPASTNVFVLSSIGLADQYPTSGLMEDFCRQLGYQARPEPKRNFSDGALAPGTARDMADLAEPVSFTRIPRTALRAAVPRQRRWQKTTAFAIPSLYIGFLRVNLRGREPEGIVEPGAEYDALLQRLETDLRQLIDPQTGQPAIEKVVRAGELYGCEPPEVLPDLIVHWKPSTHFLDHVLHPKAELTQKKPEFFRESEHTSHGFLAAAGPAIQNRGQIADVQVLDLAPTFLALLGEPKCEQMTGNIIKDLLQTELQTNVS